MKIGEDKKAFIQKKKGEDKKANMATFLFLFIL